MDLKQDFLLRWSFLLYFTYLVSGQQNYDRDRDYNNRQNDDRYRNNPDQYNRDFNRNQPYDPYNRNNQSNYDQYNRNQSGDPYNRNSNDPYNNNNQAGFNRNDPYNRNNDPYNRNNDPYGRGNDYNRSGNDYNRSGNDYNKNNDYNRNNDYNNRNSNDYNRNNDPYGRSNDQFGRNNNDRNYNDYNRSQNDRDRYGQNGSNYGGGNFGSGNNYGGFGRESGNCCEEYCYNVDEQPYIKFGSNTPYQFAYGKVSNQHIVPQCKPVQFWSVVREGTSLPDRMAIERLRQLQKIHDEIVRNYEERRSFPDKGRMCSEDYDTLKRWRWNETIAEHNAGSLTQQGADDLKFMARRYQTRLRDLLVPYTENNYFFQYTEGDKSSESFRAYAEGLFGNDAARVHANVRTDPSVYSNNQNTYGSNNYYGSQYGQNQNNQYGQNQNNQYGQNSQYGQNGYSSSSNYGNNAYSSSSSSQGQYGSQTYSSCKTFEQRMDENRNSAVEYQHFKQRPEYKEMVRNVFTRLGFKYSNDSIVEDMYDMCRYEKSWYVTRQSPWCAVFTKEQLKILEYADDLYYYYKAGYGHEYLHKNMGCSLVKDMYERFERTVNGGVEQKAIVHFRNLDTILQTLVAMDIGRDQTTLTADSYYQLNRRQWSTSDLTPFSGNLAAILYQCENQQDRHKVMFFINENPVEYPGCSVGLCTWNTVRDKFQTLAQECRLDWCERGASSNLNPQYFLISIISVILMFQKYMF